jgi:hypothetical protein
MLKIKIEIDTDNASFEDDFYGQLRNLMEQAYEKVIVQISRNNDHEGFVDLGLTLDASDKLLDVNGNSVGIVRISM